MKLNKIFAIALAALTMTACSDDAEGPVININTASGVTVEMQDATMTKPENEGLFNVPFKITGEANGYVHVTVKCEPVAATSTTEPAVENTNYVVTSKSINVPADGSASVEINPIWERKVPNDPRVFKITIVSAEGATIGQQASCTITLEDADDTYTMMTGNWQLSAINASTGEPVEYTVTIKTPEVSSEYFGTELYAFGIFGESDYLLPFVDVKIDKVTGAGTMQLGYGSMMTDGIVFNYGAPVGQAFPVCMYRNGSSVSMSHEAICTVNEAQTEIVIPDDATVFGGLYSYPAQQFTGYGVGYIRNIKLTR